MTMRILHVITSLSIGGAEHLMVELLPRLRDLGNDVEIAVFNCKKNKFFNTTSRGWYKNTLIW